ncbi:MAG: coniferyl aldehyde dehydrogenase [Candidatus Brocadiaceae bacterium]|nr:coniferyl aldehyde dehydrogenase [Candidatus Brocadiaceae bacterium]
MEAENSITNLLEMQRCSFLADDFPSKEIRIDRLQRLYHLLKENKIALCDAMATDFGSRSHYQSVVADILSTLESIKYCIKNIKKWMRSENRGAKFPLNLFGAKAEVFYQPKGVIGIISPWNFPVQLTFSPLANVFSAGNRALIKPSEMTPVTSELMKTLVAKYFASEEVVIVTGDAETGAEFVKQKFDHLVFTGAPLIAKLVARSAAENLVPLTLELGGKCPVIIAKEANMKAAIERVMSIKLLNSGQICLSPDYVFIEKDRLTEFVNGVKEFVESGFNDFQDNDDLTGIINSKNYKRLTNYIEEAQTLSQNIVHLESKNKDDLDEESGKIKPCLILEPSDDLAIMQEEIFGPILPVKTYESIESVIQYINKRERPLALYYFGNKKSDIEILKNKTTTGGMVVNDVLAHVLQDSMPLGGIGNSGMGSYHGFDGFKEFSHAKAYYKQGIVSLTSVFKPPFKEKLLGIIEKVMG